MIDAQSISLFALWLVAVFSVAQMAASLAN